MSVQISAEGPSSDDIPKRPVCNSPRRPPQSGKSVVLRLWELLQPLARFWGLVTAIGKNDSFLSNDKNSRFVFFGESSYFTISDSCKCDHFKNNAAVKKSNREKSRIVVVWMSPLSKLNKHESRCS